MQLCWGSGTLTKNSEIGVRLKASCVMASEHNFSFCSLLFWVVFNEAQFLSIELIYRTITAVLDWHVATVPCPHPPDLRSCALPSSALATSSVKLRPGRAAHMPLFARSRLHCTFVEIAPMLCVL